MTVITMTVDYGPVGHQLCQANPAGSTAMKLLGNIGRAMVWSLNSAPAASETGRSDPKIVAPRLRVAKRAWPPSYRSEEHTSELQSLMRTSSAVFCLKKKTITS